MQTVIETAFSPIDTLQCNAAIETKYKAAVGTNDPSRSRTASVQVELEYDAPVTLYMGKRKRYVTSAAFSVRCLFFKNGRVYYVPLSSRSRGYPLHLSGLVRVLVACDETDYGPLWEKIAKSLRKHKINLDVADAIDDHLCGKVEYIAGMENRWTRKDKPRRSSFKDVTNGLSLEEIWAKRATSKFGTYASLRKDGERRDRNVCLYQTEAGAWKYQAASEYAGCGNGDYYIMYSPTMAFYATTD